MLEEKEIRQYLLDISDKISLLYPNSILYQNRTEMGISISFINSDCIYVDDVMYNILKILGIEWSWYTWDDSLTKKRYLNFKLSVKHIPDEIRRFYLNELMYDNK